MFELIIGLALLPLALLGLLLLLGIIAFTWRYILAGIVFIVVLLFVLSTSMEPVYKFFIIYIAAAVIFAAASPVDEEEVKRIIQKQSNEAED